MRGLGSLSVEVVSRALGERDARPRSISQARSDTSGEERRIHRNTLLENAEAGRYGAEIRRAALSRPNLKQLADELEQREADGDLHLTRLADALSLDGLMKGLPRHYRAARTLSMTLRAMHRAPSALCQAIGLLKIEHPVGNAEARMRRTVGV